MVTGTIEDEIVDRSNGPLWVSVQASVNTDLYLQVEEDSFLWANEQYAPAFDRNDFCFSAVDAGDFDNDGLDDILITGIPQIAWLTTGIGGAIITNWPRRSKPSILHNKGETFTNLEVDIPATWSCCGINSYDFESSGGYSHVSMGSFESSSIVFADFNQDGSLDILREGNLQERTSAIYENRTIDGNMAPSSPNNLATTFLSCDSILLTWDHAIDDLTAVHNLRYRFYLGTSPGGNEIFSSKNIQGLRNTYFMLPPLEDGRYYWSVKTIDNGQAESEFAVEESFEVACISNSGEELATEDFSVFPNPFNNTVSITAGQYQGKVDYRLFNQLGELIAEGSFTNSIELADINLPAQVLSLELRAGDTVFLKKLVKLN